MKFKYIQVMNFNNALRGMRNPKESWHLSDSKFGLGTWDTMRAALEDVKYHWTRFAADNNYDDVNNSSIDNRLSSNGIIRQENGVYEYAFIGPKDMKLAKTLITAGSEHRKFLRQIFVSVDITAPLFFFKEFDTYKISTTSNSTSTMHTIKNKPITLDLFETDDFQEDKLIDADTFFKLLEGLEKLRLKFIETEDKGYWKELIRWLPESWLQTRTVTMNYENILSMYHQRKNHKLSEWANAYIENFINTLPYAKIFFSDEKIA